MKDPEASELLPVVDAAVAERVLVFGSLPPAGRDLDLLVRPGEASALATALGEGGFRRSGRMWARFRGCSVSVVELIPAAALHLPAAELDSLFAEGSPLPGLSRVVEPAPHHALLVLARRLVHERRLLAKHRHRIDRVLELDPGAWAAASRRAAMWKAEAALQRLRALHSSDEPSRTCWRALLRRPRRTRVIALSGPDAERRHRHAMALGEALDSLGLDAAIERPLPADPARTSERMERSAFRSAAGALEATRAAIALWRPIWRRLARGGVVIYDGSAVDAVARLDGSGRMASLPLRLAPGAVRSFVLEGVADDEPSRRRAQAYDAAARRIAARSLPPGLPRDDACTEIAEDVFTALTRRSLAQRLYAAIRGRC